MAGFDPYHKWLGIPPQEQPPNHYRLLGISPFESDGDVIDAAADRQMTYVRSCAVGEHVQASQNLLNELSAARLCLLTAAKKIAYDAELRAKIKPTRADAGVPPAPSSASQTSLRDESAAEGEVSGTALVRSQRGLTRVEPAIPILIDPAQDARRVRARSARRLRQPIWRRWAMLAGAAVLVVPAVFWTTHRLFNAGVQKPAAEAKAPTTALAGQRRASKRKARDVSPKVDGEHSIVKTAAPGKAKPAPDDDNGVPDRIEANAGSALKFVAESQQYVSSASMPALSGNHARTVSMWLTTTLTSTSQPLFDSGGTTQGVCFILSLAKNSEVGGRPPAGDGGLYFSCFSNDLYCPAPGMLASIANGERHHVAFTWDTTHAAWYLDGVALPACTYNPQSGKYSELQPAGPVALPLSLNATQNPVWVGHTRNNTWGRGNTYFDGTLADVRVYSTALTAPQIKALYDFGNGLVVPDTARGSLAAWWPYNDGNGGTAADLSGNGNTGTLNGGPTWAPLKDTASEPRDRIDANAGSALKFVAASQQYVSSASMPALGGNHARTVSMWLTTTLTSTSQPLFDSGGTTQGVCFILSLAKNSEVRGRPPAGDGGLYFSCFFNDLYCPAPGMLASIANGERHHVAFTWDTTHAAWYLDGVALPACTYNPQSGKYSELQPAGPVALPLSLNATQNAVWVGHTRNSTWGRGNTYFDGTLADVRVYSMALTAQQIKALYDFGNGLVVPDTARGSLAAWWPYNDGNGGTAADLSGNGNTGTLHGGATWVPSILTHR